MVQRTRNHEKKFAGSRHERMRKMRKVAGQKKRMKAAGQKIRNDEEKSLGQARNDEEENSGAGAERRRGKSWGRRGAVNRKIFGAGAGGRE